MKVFRQLWYILDRRERIEGLFLLVFMTLGAGLETVSIGLVLPFIPILNDPSLLLKYTATRKLAFWLGLHQPLQLLMAAGFGLIGAFIFKSVVLIALSRFEFRYIFSIHRRLSKQLMAGYLYAPYTFHLQRNSAELIQAAVESVHRFASAFLIGLVMLLGELLLVTALSILLLIVQPMATLAAIAIIGLPTIVMERAMRRRLTVAGQVASQSFAAVLQWIDQAIGGIKETIVTGRASFFVGRQDYYLGRLTESMRTLTYLSGMPRLLMDTVTVIAVVAIVLIIMMRGQNLQSVLPLLTVFAVAAIRLLPSASRITNSLGQLRYHYSATEIVYKELLETQSYQPQSQRVRAPDLGQPPPSPFRRSLVLENVSFTYPSKSLPAVDGVSMEIAKGDWIALVGLTGAGKTTLIDLILGLFTPTCGRILVDGRDLQDDILGWQCNIGLVPQSIYLMDDTIRRNVAFGLPDEMIDDERVWDSLRAAQIDAFVRALPGGLDAMVGERGDRISGGERQRLGIARALYCNFEVLVIDEGTAHLDNETESSIGRTLKELRGKKTIVTIAHRLALVKDCDRIFFLDTGRIRACGNYSRLLATDPAFRSLAGASG